MESERVTVPEQSSRAGRIVIADDHEVARMGLVAILDDEPGLHVVGQARNGREALALCRSLRPDLILMDVRMPDIDGLAATALLKADSPCTSVIIVTFYESVDYLRRALQVGAAGYLLKDASREVIIDAVRRVLDGEFLLQAELTGLLRQLAAEAPPAPPSATVQLTPRECEVLLLVVQGYTNPQIARKLLISLSTAKAHVASIIDKLGVSDRTQAAVRAIQLGLVR